MQKLKPMYQFEPEIQVIKKGSPGKIWADFRSSRWQIFFKIGVLKSLANSTGKKAILETLFNKVAILKALLKRDFDTGVFPWNLQNF